MNTKSLTIVIFLCFWIFSFQSANSQHITYPDSLNKTRLYTVIAGESLFYVGGSAFLQYIWYKDHEQVPFHYYNDNKGWLQMDKWGHMYGAYYESYFGYHALRWAGVKEQHSLIYGGSLGFILQAPIEIFDGLYEGYGFSWGDIAANTLGAGLFTAQQAIWQKQYVTMKFSYSPSPYREYNPSTLGDTHAASLFMDYNGHTYWLSWDIKGIAGIKNWPDWLQIATGYSGNGMLGEFKNPEYDEGRKLPDFQRYRQILLAPSIDLRKIDTNSQFLNRLFQYISILKLPLPALEFNEKGKMKLHGIYY